MSFNLFKANRQWSTRPADETFQTLQALYDACKEYAGQAQSKTVAYADLRVESQDGEVTLTGKSGIPAKFTHWGFGQLCQRVGAPSAYLRELPATLACQNLNYGLAERGSADGEDKASILFHSNGGLVLRALTSEAYSRIWNYEIAARLLELQARGWEPAMPDINTSADDHPALYASDHDMFAFLRNRSAIIRETGNPDGLQRGVIVENSEVGASALKLTRFLYRVMCGNHIIWDASRVVEISVRHVGDARYKWDAYAAAVRQYAETGAEEEESRIGRARVAIIGKTKEETLDRLFGMRALGIPYKTLDAAYTHAFPDLDGAPNTQWGMVQAITRHSQTIPYADQRTALDKAAGKIMEANF